jgi:hypothetical protein
MRRTAAASITIEIERARTAAPKLVRTRALPYEEALALPARLLGELPLAPSMGVHVRGVPGVVRIELDPARAEIARSEGEITIDADEWRAISFGAEADRLWPADFAALCARKQSEPSFRIEPEMALAGAQIDPDRVWNAQRVLERIGADVLSIDL